MQSNIFFLVAGCDGTIQVAVALANAFECEVAPAYMGVLEFVIETCKDWYYNDIGEQILYLPPNIAIISIMVSWSEGWRVYEET